MSLKPFGVGFSAMKTTFFFVLEVVNKEMLRDADSCLKSKEVIKEKNGLKLFRYLSMLKIVVSSSKLNFNASLFSFYDNFFSLFCFSSNVLFIDNSVVK